VADPRKDAIEGSPVQLLVVDHEDVGVSQGARLRGGACAF
jgi:hypothetical protein